MTEEQKHQYEAQGYLVVEDVLDPDELGRARAAFDTAAGAGGLDDLPNWDDLFIRAAEHPVLFPFIHRIVGSDVQVRSLRGLSIPPGDGGERWHRQVAGLLGVYHPASTLSVQAFFYLDGGAEESPGLAVVPGSHRFKPDLGLPGVDRVEQMPHHVVLRAKAGAAVILHGNIWQARTSGRAAQRILEYVYVHCWMRQALPELSGQAMEIVGGSHNLSQLFGVGDVTDAGGYWGRKVEGYEPSTGLPERRFSEFKVVGKGITPNR